HPEPFFRNLLGDLSPFAHSLLNVIREAAPLALANEHAPFDLDIVGFVKVASIAGLWVGGIAFLDFFDEGLVDGRITGRFWSRLDLTPSGQISIPQLSR